MKSDKFDCLIQRGHITLRRMQDELGDYQLLTKWLTDKKVLAFYDGRDKVYSPETIKAKYSPRIRGENPVVPCIILYQDLPIGYLQYYPLNKDLKRLYNLAASDNIYGADLFIGETSHWNKGLGTQVVLSLTAYLFAELQADKVTLDPRINNPRAIRCYEKCGFRKVKKLPEYELHEGKYWDNWLMIATRN